MHFFVRCPLSRLHQQQTLPARPAATYSNTSMFHCHVSLVSRIRHPSHIMKSELNIVARQCLEAASSMDHHITMALSMSEVGCQRQSINHTLTLVLPSRNFSAKACIMQTRTYTFSCGPMHTGKGQSPLASFAGVHEYLQLCVLHARWKRFMGGLASLTHLCQSNIVLRRQCDAEALHCQILTYYMVMGCFMIS